MRITPINLLTPDQIRLALIYSFGTMSDKQLTDVKQFINGMYEDGIDAKESPQPE